MSYLFWSFVFFSAALVKGKSTHIDIPPQYAPEILTAAADCVTKTGVSTDITKQIVNWSLEDNEAVRKFLYCFGTTSGYVDEAGHFIVDRMVTLVGDNKLKDQFGEVLSDCNKNVGADKYETIFKTAVCFHDNSPLWFNF